MEVMPMPMATFAIVQSKTNVQLGYVLHQLQTRDSRRAAIAVTADATLQMLNIAGASMPDIINMLFFTVLDLHYRSTMKSMIMWCSGTNTDFCVGKFEIQNSVAAVFFLLHCAQGEHRASVCLSVERK